MKQYIVDAFTDRVFSGNPAAVCICDVFPPDALMQKIAQENNLSETAFLVRESDRYKLRWFTPGGEIDLCGHATLAAAFVLLNYVMPSKEKMEFLTQSGVLTVIQNGDLYEMEFPAYALKPAPVTPQITDALGAKPKKVCLGRDLLCVFENERTVRKLSPDMEKVKRLPGLLLHVTAPGADFDCVSRSFAPKLGVPEDPVCGSGHCHIVPYWAAKSGKRKLTAYQASARGGALFCRCETGKVLLAGKAALFSVGDIFPDGVYETLP